MNLFDKSLDEFISATAAKTPTPGGGSVAGVVGALSAALAEMTLNFSRGKKSLAEFDEYHQHLSGRLAKAGQMFAQLIEDDVAAFTLYQQASRMEDGPAKAQATELATAAAINVPLEMIKLSLVLLEDFEVLCQRCSKFIITDLLSAGALAVAVVKLSYYNVRINLGSLKDESTRAELRESIEADLTKARGLLETIEQKCDGLLPA